MPEPRMINGVQVGWILSDEEAEEVLAASEKPRSAPEPTVRATAYAVSCLPPDHVDAYCFTLRVEWRGTDRWCVTDGAYCYRKDGHKSYESNPSSRTDRFKKAYRFSLEDALALAKRLAPKMTINGHTVEDVLNRRVKPAVE